MTKKKIPDPYQETYLYGGGWAAFMRGFPDQDGKYHCKICRTEISGTGVCSKECYLKQKAKEDKAAKAAATKEKNRRAELVKDLTVGELEDILKNNISSY